MKNLIVVFFLIFGSVNSWSQTRYLSSEELSKKVVFDLDEALRKKNRTLSLFLSDSSISTFPQEIFKLKNLQSLSIVGSQIQFVPSDIKLLNKLWQLDLSSNSCLNLGSCLESISQIPNLKELILAKSKLSEIPQNIGQLSGLEELFLYWNNIEKLPSQIGDLGSLKTLLLGGNQLIELPTEFSNLGDLELLTLDNNRFRNLPAELIHLTKLKSIYFGNEGIDVDQALDVLSNCLSLEIIHISDVRITKDAGFGRLKSLPKLRRLILNDSFESIQDIPLGLHGLECEIYIQLSANFTKEDINAISEINPNIEITYLTP